MEPRGKDRREHDAGLLRRGDHRVAPLERDLERLLDDDVLARLRRGDRRLHVHAAGRADRDDIDRRIGQHLVQVVIDLAADLGAELVGRRR